MPILPQAALFVIFQSWSLVLQLVSVYWYERQLVRYQDHWLVQLHQIANLSRLEQACAGFQANNGRGAPIAHPPTRLVRALLIKYLYHQALRPTEELIDTQISREITAVASYMRRILTTTGGRNCPKVAKINHKLL
jgi:hypothetical protein